MKVELFIGNRNYSSWSLRPWLALKWANIDFVEHLIDLDQPGYGESAIQEILAVSPAGKVPALRLTPSNSTDSHVIWDSLAIAEWAAEQCALEGLSRQSNMRAAPLLPADPIARAKVRSVVCEMHSGFAAVRRDLTMNIRRRCVAYDLAQETLAEIARLNQLFTQTRLAHAASGPFLFGERSLADAFFTPVATRFRTYAIKLSPVAQSYCDQLLADSAFLQWENNVLSEPVKFFSRIDFEAMYPARPDATAG